MTHDTSLCFDLCVLYFVVTGKAKRKVQGPGTNPEIVAACTVCGFVVKFRYSNR